MAKVGKKGYINNLLVFAKNDYMRFKSKEIINL